MSHPTEDQESARCTECGKVLGPLVAYLDGECTPEEAREVERQNAECAACANRLATHRLVGDHLDTIHHRVPDGLHVGDLSTRVRARAQKSSQRRRRLLSWGAGLSAAAALLLIARLAIRQPPEPVQPTQLVAEEEVISDLDILEVFADVGLEPTPELVDALLASEELGFEDEIFDLLIEEGITSKNL